MIFAIASALALASAGQGPAPADVRTVRVLLSSIEDSPNYVVIRTLPTARAALAAIAADDATPMAIRGRALEGIASFGDDAGFAAVQRVLEDPVAAPLLRRSAVLALGIHFQLRALPIVASLAASGDDLQLRRVAAMTLGRIDGDAALKTARGLAAAERDDIVRADLAAAVHAIEARRSGPKGGAR